MRLARRVFSERQVSLVPMLTKETLPSLIESLCCPTAESAAVSNSADRIVACINSGTALRSSDHVRLASALEQHGVRNEKLLYAIFWGALKKDCAPLSEILLAKHDNHRAIAESARHVVGIFRAMATSGFVNDPQLILLGLGRCIELSPYFTLWEVGEAYKGLAALNMQYYSTTQAHLYRSDVEDDVSLRCPVVNACESDTSAIINQPNLIDVLCGELESRMHALREYLCSPVPTRGIGPCQSNEVLAKQKSRKDIVVSRTGDSFCAHKRHSLAEEDGESADDVLRMASSCADILRSLAVVGVVQARALHDLHQLLVLLSNANERGGNLAFVLPELIVMLESCVAVKQRAVDALECAPEHDVGQSKRELISCLTSLILHVPHSRKHLCRAPQLVIKLRRLFETCNELARSGNELWDELRTIRIAHRHVTQNERTRSHSSLMSRPFAVKRLSPEPGDIHGEKFIPPGFKTWRSPQHTPRGGHTPSKGGARKTAFGTRRISKNYVKGLQKKYCPRL